MKTRGRFALRLVAVAATLSLASGALAEPPAGNPSAGNPSAGAPARMPGAPAKGPGRGPGAGGGRPAPPPAWMRGLYGPWLVLSKKDAIGLRPDQVTALEKIMGDGKKKREAADAKVRQASEALSAATSAETIDGSAVLAKFDALAAAEASARRSSLESMLAVRKLLDADQLAKLRGMARPGGPGRGRPAVGAPGVPGAQPPAAGAPAAAAPAPH